MTGVDLFTSIMRSLAFAGSVIFLVCVAETMGHWARTRGEVHPFDWWEACPELRPDHDHHHVKLVPADD